MSTPFVPAQRVGFGRPSAVAAGDGASDDRARQVRQLAHEFEAMLLHQMLTEMRRSLVEEEDGNDTGLGAAAMGDTLDVELARQLSAQGGIGLSRVVEGQLLRSGARQEAGAPVPERAARAPAAAEDRVIRHTARAALPAPAGHQMQVPVDPSASPVATPTRVDSAASPPGAVADTASPGGTAPLHMPLADPVSSAFGWRRNPFGRGRRFHAGVDIAAAYGRDVPSAAAGHVVFAGEQKGYGNTVVIRHGAGVITRYAHLSSIAVSPGQELASGETVGRVGRTGRSTGPHLHFEVTLDGRRVDPALVAARVEGGFKVPGVSDDYPLGRVSSPATGADDED